MFGIDKTGKSLRDFIDENQNLLSAMAVLVAIASFVTNLPIHWLGSTLLFLTIAGIVTVWVELYILFPKTGSMRLMIFKNVLSFGLIGFVFYWFLAFGTFWNIFSFVPLFAMLLYMSLTVLTQLVAFPIVRKIFGKKGNRNVWQKILIVAYVCAVGYGILWLFAISVGAAPGINYLLQLIRISFH